MSTITKPRNLINQPAKPLGRQEAQNIARGYDAHLDSSLSLERRGKLTPAEKKSFMRKLGRRVLTLGLVTGIAVGVLHDGSDKKTPTVPAIVQEGDSPQSLVDRYNDESVNVPKLADQMQNQGNVQDGLIPGEQVRVPVESPDQAAGQAKATRLP